MMRHLKIIAILLFCFYTSTAAQPADSAISAIAPKIFIDCRWCDIDYIRDEITFINYVYDRKNADIHLLITTRSTGSGGSEYSLTFIGQNAFKAHSDTLIFTTLHDDTEDLLRQKLVKHIKIGLIPFLSNTPIMEDISIQYTKKTSTIVKEDHWKNWVFRFSLNGWFNGEKNSRNSNIYARVSADRITDDWKIRLSIFASYQENKYRWDEQWFSSTQKSNSFSGSFVRSLSNHWSLGGFLNANSSSYMNIRSGFNASPAIEYNIFPYSESTRREIRVMYRIGSEYVFYDSETIYFKTKEQLFGQSLKISLKFKQPWGTAYTDIIGSHYFHDLAKNHLTIFSDLSIRLFKGFSINLYGGFSRIHDQLHLRRTGMSKEDVLLRRYSLETSYNYWGSLGFQYAFGSIYNNIVNPRFGN